MAIPEDEQGLSRKRREAVGNELYRVRQPGDILRLPIRLPYYEPIIEPAGYVLLSVGDTCCLALVSEDAEGRWCATSTLVDVGLADLACFIEMGLKVEPLG